MQSFAPDAPARATAIYWNTLMVSAIIAGPAVGFVAQIFDFKTVVQMASFVAALAAGILVLGIRFERKTQKQETI